MGWPVFHFRLKQNNKKIEVTTETSRKNGPEKRKTRKGTTQRNTEPYTITAPRSYRVEQKHNIIQEALKKSLSDRYGEENIILEENYVDVRLIQPNYLGFYEVKSSSYASDCIKEALGQVLFYSFQDQDDRTKKIFVVGQYPANKQDLSYIRYIKEIINVDFEYIYVDIE